MISLHTHQEVEILNIYFDFGTHTEPFAKYDPTRATVYIKGFYSEGGYLDQADLPWAELEKLAIEKGAELISKYENIYRTK